MAEVGVEEVAAAPGGGIGALDAGVKEADIEVEEATEGVMIETMLARISSPSQRSLRAMT
jgi:hypothetical protein